MAKWTEINGGHFNIDLMTTFFWRQGKLYIYWIGNEKPETFSDLRQANYLRLCRDAGVQVVKG